MSTTKIKPKVLLVGWDSADWKIINPLLDAGELPALQSLVDNGVCGKISTLDPILSPLLWTSIATGMRPFKHGILGFLEPDSTGKKLRQTHITSRKVKAIWNILNQNNLKSNVVGWWPSHPAEPINGHIVTNFFQSANWSETWDNWPLKKGSIHPETLENQFAELRIHPTELTINHLLPFIPNAKAIDQEKDRSLNKLAKQIAECSTIHNAATYLLEKDKDWDFMGVYYEAPDLVSHSFMKFHPPKMKHIHPKQFELYKDVVNGIYKFHDMMLGRLLQYTDENTTVIIVSDHGFFSDHLRPIKLPKEPAAIALEHSPYGIFVAKGPNIKKDDNIIGANILDITPTILTMFDLPIGNDMDGKPLLQIFKENITPKYINSWEDIEGNSGQHPKELKEDIYEIKDDKAIQQLADLGYVEADPSKTENENINLINTIKESQFYLARSYYNAKEINKAIDILEELVKDKPVKSRYTKYLIECQLSLNNTDRCMELLEELKQDKNIEKDSLLSIEGNIYIYKKQYKKALNLFNKALKLKERTTTKMAIANAYKAMNDYDKAIKIYDEVLNNNPNNFTVLYHIGVCYYQMADYENAINYLLDSVGLLYFNPNAHYYIGLTFKQLQMYNESAQAFEVSLSQNSTKGKALSELEDVCNNYLKTPERYQKIINNNPYKDAPTCYIVSGLPRSGTSMMMQIMEAAGFDIFTDNLRSADENNKKGYYEHEAVKTIHLDATWLKEAHNKTIKIISPLLKYLPLNRNYKIIYMKRDIDEVLNSQYKMLNNLGKINADTAHFNMENNFKKLEEDTSTFLSNKINIDTLYINYVDCIDNPKLVAQKLSTFLDKDISEIILLKIIEKNLYRSKIS